MAWLRKMPMYAVLLVALAVLIAAAALGYDAYVTATSTTVRGQLNSGGNGEPYEWNGQRLFLQSVDARRDSTCVITRRDGVEQSVWVPRNSTKGMFNTPDFTEVSPQPGTMATMICSYSMRVYAGDAAVDRARTVNSRFFHLGVPTLITIPVLLALTLSIPRPRTSRLPRHGDISG